MTTNGKWCRPCHRSGGLMMHHHVTSVAGHKLRQVSRLSHCLRRSPATQEAIPMEALRRRQTRMKKLGDLYEKGKVYDLPHLAIPREQVASRQNNEMGNESTSLLENSSVSEEESQTTVKSLVKETLQRFMSPHSQDLPSLLLHNTHLSKKENVILIVDRKLGVLVMTINCTKDVLNFEPVKKAAEHLNKAKESVSRHLQGLVESCDVTAILALPHLLDRQADVVRRRIREVEILVGLDADHYSEWLGDLRSERLDCLWKCSNQEGEACDAIYEKVASSFLTLAGCGGESPPSPDPAQSWLLTPAQVEVRDSTARLLHVWGPPGSGKTTLLVHRARQWLAQGKAVVLGVGRQSDAVRLACSKEKITKGQQEDAIDRLRFCRTYEEVLTAKSEIKGVSHKVEICIVIDNPKYEKQMIQKVLSSVKQKEPICVMTTWQKNFSEVDPDQARIASNLGWEIIHLPDCIRCTKDTVELLNLLGKDVFPPIPSCSLPRDPDIPAWSVVDHCLHPDHVTNVSRCDGCKTAMSEVLPSLEQGLQWNNWIALHTGNKFASINLADVHQALLHLGVPASYQGHKNSATSPDIVPDSPVQVTFEERVIKGVDTAGLPTVHLLETKDFKGMERDGVILVHYDDRDNDPRQQSQPDRQTRLELHRRQWRKAVSCSRGQVILLLLTPSPARSLLDLPEPVMAQQGDAPESAIIQVETEM